MLVAVFVFGAIVQASSDFYMMRQRISENEGRSAAVKRDAQIAAREAQLKSRRQRRDALQLKRRPTGGGAQRAFISQWWKKNKDRVRAGYVSGSRTADGTPMWREVMKNAFKEANAEMTKAKNEGHDNFVKAQEIGAATLQSHRCRAVHGLKRRRQKTTQRRTLHSSYY